MHSRTYHIDQLDSVLLLSFHNPSLLQVALAHWHEYYNFMEKKMGGRVGECELLGEARGDIYYHQQCQYTTTACKAAAAAAHHAAICSITRSDAEVNAKLLYFSAFAAEAEQTRRATRPTITKLSSKHFLCSS